MFPEIPEDLSTLSDEELQDLHDQAVAAFNEAADDPNADLDELNGLTEGIERLRSEQSGREEAAAEKQEKLDALRGRVNASTDEKESDESEEDDSNESDADSESNTEAADDEAEVETDNNKEESVTASAKKPAKATLSKLRKSAPARTQPRQEANAFMNLTAAADVSGFAAGQNLGSIRELSEAMINRRHSMGRGNGDNVPVATFHRDFPSERKLDRTMSAEQIMDRLAKFDAGNFDSIVAAGGLCAPVAGYYDQPVLAETGRPVRDALANFNADRGGIRFVPAPNFGDITSGQGIITAAQDAAGTTKNCFTVTCAAEEQVVISAIYSCLTFGNMGARTFPERVEAWNKIALAQYDRLAETFLLDRLAALSTPVQVTGYVGGGRELFARVGQAAVGYRSRNRMSPTSPLRLLLPSWVKEMVRSDFARTLGEPDNIMAITDQLIDSWFSVRNVRVSWYLDSKTGGNQVIGSATGGQTYTDLATTSGQATVSSATAGFTSADVGRRITGPGIPNNATIASVQSATGATLSANATATGTGVTFTIARLVASQFPNLIFGYLYAEGAFLHLDGGTLDIGLVRDSTLNANNQFQIFNEGFENVAKVGPDAVELRLNLNADGSYGAARAVPNPLNA